MTYAEKIELIAHRLKQLCNDVQYDEGRVWTQYVNDAHRIAETCGLFPSDKPET